MKTKSIALPVLGLFVTMLFSLCSPKPAETPEAEATDVSTENFGGFASQVEWGEKLVKVSDCDVCHSPKMMTDQGPAIDPALRLSGHPAQMPPPDVDRKMIESNGYGLANPMMTAWVGPWGISYAGNLTSDPTGIGNWTEEAFLRAIREGKFKGLEGGRTLLPPMPWQAYNHYTDDELKAIFAFLKTVPAVNNVVPPPVPPVSAAM